MLLTGLCHDGSRPPNHLIGARKAQEIDDVVANTKLVDEPKMVFGHSSGLSRAAVIYEPPIVTGSPIGGEATKRVRAAVEASKLAKAMAIFSQHMLNPVLSHFVGVYAALHPHDRKLIPSQLHVEEIDELGGRLNEYAKIAVPVKLISGAPPELSDVTQAGWPCCLGASVEVLDPRRIGKD